MKFKQTSAVIASEAICSFSDISEILYLSVSEKLEVKTKVEQDEFALYVGALHSPGRHDCQIQRKNFRSVMKKPFFFLICLSINANHNKLGWYM